MRFNLKYCVALVAVGAALATAGCGGGGGFVGLVDVPMQRSSPVQSGNLVYTLISDHSIYSRSQVQNYSITIENVGTKDETYQSGCLTFPRLRNGSGTLIYKNVVVCQSLILGNLKPGEKATMNDTWDPTVTPLASGAYSAEFGISTVSGGIAPTIPIVVQ